MKIKQLEQSGFIIEASDGFTLGIDIGSYTPFESIKNVSLDAMLISHIHGDHFSVEHIKKLSPKKVYLNEECIEALGEEALRSQISQIKIGDHLEITPKLKVYVFDVDHGPNVKLRPRENFGFLINVDGMKIYFAGDMFYVSGIDVSELDIDIALIPVGGFYTFGPAEAVAFTKQFKSIAKVIPMHYEKTPDTKAEFMKLSAVLR